MSVRIFCYSFFSIRLSLADVLWVRSQFYPLNSIKKVEKWLEGSPIQERSFSEADKIQECKNAFNIHDARPPQSKYQFDLIECLIALEVFSSTSNRITTTTKNKEIANQRWIAKHKEEKLPDDLIYSICMGHCVRAQKDFKLCAKEP